MPNISYFTSDLRGLFKKDALFQWTEAHDATFQNIKKKDKKKISENVCLKYFDTAKDVVLQVDASYIGLVAALLQDGKPVACAYCITSCDPS